MAEKNADKRCKFFFEDEIKLYCPIHGHYFILADTLRRRSNLKELIEDMLLSPEAMIIASRELSTPA